MAKNKAIAACSPDMRRVYLDVSGKDVELVGDLKIGAIATFAVKGKVVSLSTRQDEYSDGKKTGSISIENPKIKVIGTNEFAELVAGDD